MGVVPAPALPPPSAPWAQQAPGVAPRLTKLENRPPEKQREASPEGRHEGHREGRRCALFACWRLLWAGPGQTVALPSRVSGTGLAPTGPCSSWPSLPRAPLTRCRDLPGPHTQQSSWRVPCGVCSPCVGSQGLPQCPTAVKPRPAGLRVP